MSAQRQTIALCVLFVLLWSSGFIGAKFGLGYAGTFTLLSLRYMLVTFVLFIAVCVMRAWQPLPMREIIRHACIGILAHAAWLSAVLGAIDLGISAGLAAFITALQPIMTGALSSSMTGEKVSARQWAGLGLGLLAVVVVVSDKVAIGGTLAAYALPFLAVVAISVASLIDRQTKLRIAEAPPVVLTIFIHCAASLLVLTPLAYGLEGFVATPSYGLVFSVVWLAIVVSLAAYGIMFILLRRMPAADVASLTYLAPPTTMLIAFVLFGESLSVIDLMGLAIASLAVWMTIKKGKPATLPTVKMLQNKDTIQAS